MAHLLQCVVCFKEMASDADCCPHCGTREKPKRPHCNFCDDERKLYNLQELHRDKKLFGWTEWRESGWTGLISRKQKDRKISAGITDFETEGGRKVFTIYFENTVLKHQAKTGDIREEICSHCSRFYER